MITPSSYWLFYIPYFVIITKLISTFITSIKLYIKTFRISIRQGPACNSTTQVFKRKHILFLKRRSLKMSNYFARKSDVSIGGKQYWPPIGKWFIMSSIFKTIPTNPSINSDNAIRRHFIFARSMIAFLVVFENDL